MEINVNKDERKETRSLQKSYFDVLGLCCSSEIPLIEKILKPLNGVVEVSVVVPSRTVIVLHDPTLITQDQIVKALNQARLEANVRLKGKENYKAKWPNPYVIICGLLLALSFLKYVFNPLQWLAVAAVAIGVWPVILRGVVAIRNFTLDVNILVLIAVIGTIAMRDYVEAGTIVFLFTIAEWLESRASQKATAVMSSLLNMAPQKATIAETGEVVNVEDVKLNTIIAVKAGEMIPIDGMVVEGTCEVDEKTLTGESYPVSKQKDSNVWAGTVNVNGYISVKTTALSEDCAVAKMARLVEEAQNNRSSVQRLIDRCAKYYTPAVVLMSAGLAVVPAILRVHNLKHWFYLALVVLVSACPCGLILSTPVATFCALSRAATSGLLIKGGDYLEILAKVKVMAFDKTGTITRGEFTMMTFVTLADDVSLSTLLYWVSSIESKSSHPIASVLVDYAKSQCVDPKPDKVEAFQNFPGEGVSGIMDGREFYIGNKKLAQRADCSIDSSIVTKEGRTPGYVYSGGTLIGSFSLSDNCRTGAAVAIKELKAMGIRTALLTGDGQSAAMYAQEQLGNILDDVHAELLPADKANIITGYKKMGATSMVGDGVNDAPALATADVGISMGVSGSALATETGHVILMSNDIRKIPKAIKLARKARQKVIQNIFISIITKAGVLASAFAWHPLVWLAVLVDVGTCLIVILNSMLLLREDRAHGGKWYGLFSCHSHKSKCHSTSHHSKMHQQCCTKNVPPKACESTSQHSKMHQQCCTTNMPPEACESTRCSSHTSATPCQTSIKCHTTSSMKKQQCCASSCEASKKIESDSHPHHVVTVHDLHEAHTSQVASKALHCTSHDCSVSDAPNEIGHDHHLHSPCHDEGQCLDSLESQIKCHASSCEEPLSECHHGHSENSQNPVLSDHLHDLIICCASKTENKAVCNDHGTTSHDIHEPHHHHHRHHHHHHHHHSVQETSGHCHKESDVLTCEEHCPSSHEIHEDEHHHHSAPHGICHSEAVAKHACMSLRKREIGACCKSYRRECCSSQGHFASGFGGLTEIVSE